MTHLTKQFVGCVIAAMAVCTLVTSARAIVVDFQDLPTTTHYPVSSSFSSGGINFGVTSYGGGGEVIAVGSSDKELFLYGNPGLIVEVPTSTIYASIEYNDSCRGCGGFKTVVNGIQLPTILSPSSLVGVSVPGVQVAIEDFIETRSGRLTFTGPLTSLMFGRLGDHVQTIVDNLVLVTLPESGGDYNNDGKVDAADYVIWRKSSPTNSPMANDATPANVDGDDYARWRANFGDSPDGAGGDALVNAVPEPTSVVFVLLALGLLRSARRPLLIRPAVLSRGVHLAV